MIVPELIFAKTTKGVEEIAHRTHRLPNRLRTLLVMVDGASTAKLLQEKAAAIGKADELLHELWTQGFIGDSQGTAAAPFPAGQKPSAQPGNGAHLPAEAAAKPGTPILSSTQSLAEAKSLLRYCVRNGAGLWDSRALNKALDQAHNREQMLACVDLVAVKLADGPAAAMVVEMRTQVRTLLG
jgi:hypothetical protein